jgi:hypothetical protein
LICKRAATSRGIPVFCNTLKQPLSGGDATTKQIRRVLSAGDTTPCSSLKKSTEISEEHIALLAICFQAGFLFGLFFDPEDGGDMFLRNVS